MSISPEYDTAQSQSPRGMILRKVNLPGVSYCTESFMTPESQQQFLKTFAQAFKGTVSLKKLWIHILLLRVYIFHFWKKY